MGAPWEKYQQQSAAPEGPWSKYKAGGTPAASPTDYQDAQDNPEWVKNARTLYKEVNKKDPASDYEATNFLKDYIYDFNYRLAGSDKVGLRNTFGIAGDVGSFSPEGKKAFLDAQNQYENFGYSWKGAGEAAKRMITDPTNLIGLTGGGLVIKQGAKEGIEQLAKQGIKQGVKRGVATGAVEGAGYGAASDLGQQMAQVNAGGQESIDPAELAKSAGIGAGLGAGLGGAAGGVGGYFAGRNPTVRAAREITRDAEGAVRGAEITTKLADVQSTRGAPMGLADVNQVVDLEQGGLIDGIKNLGLPRDQQDTLIRSLKKSRGISTEELAKLRETEAGAAVADNILRYKQMRDMVQPKAAEGGLKRSVRVGLDYLPVPKVVGDAIKYAVLKPRVTGEEAISKVVDPRNVEIAKEIIRLQGQSAATKGREWLLQAGLDMAKARKVMRETQKAQMAAEKAQRIQEFEAKRSEKLNLANANRDMRFQERMLKQRDQVEKQAAQETARAEAKNIADAKRSMAFQSKMEGQKVRETSDNIAKAKQEQYFQIRMAQQKAKEEMQAQRAIDDLEKAAEQAKSQQERSFNKALAETQRKMRAARALERQRQAALGKAPSPVIDVPPAGQTIGTSPKAPRSTKPSGDTWTKEERQQFAREGGRIRNEQRWQGGKDTIQEYEQNALDVAKEQPKDLRRVLERAIADMRLAKNNQQARYKAYFDAIDAAAPLGEEALQVVDDALYFLVKKYQ